MEKLRILHLEDDLLDAELSCATLEDDGIGCEATCVQTREDFEATLEEGGFDLVLADYSLPAFDGLSALEMTREAHPELPFILVSGAIGEELAVEAMRNGATDYVLKHRLGRLVPVVRRAMREAEERSKRRRAEEELREVREAERTRIARDLHDVVLQDLTYTMRTMQNDDRDTDPDEVLAALRRSVHGLRGAVYNLRLEAVGEEPFSRSVESLVEQNRRMNPGCEVDLEVDEGLKLSEKPGKELLRIIGEALTNARRHSGARRVRVALGASEGRLWAEVGDDGRGFDPARTPDGLGSRGMRERARALGGNLKINSEPGEGTKVCFEMTLEGNGHLEPEEEEEARILLVDDHASLRQATASVFEKEPGFSVVGQAGSLSEVRRMLAASRKVDVAIVDLGLPDGFGGDLIGELRAQNPQAQALVLSASLDRAEIARAVEGGAAGVLHKSASMDEVVEAVRRLRAGEVLLPLEEVVELLRFAGARREEEQEARRAMAELTPREIEVLQSLAEGLDGKGIAKRLHISAVTERNHMASISAKLGVHSRLQALVFAARHGMVDIR